jgi:hypothetical protein
MWSDRGYRNTARVRRRGAYLYVAVLFTSLMVAAIVAGSLAVSTSQLRRGNDRADRLLAVQLAESELHLQATRMQASIDWRTSLSNNQFSAWRNTLGGSVRHRFFDSDGSLSDDAYDNVTLTVHARVNLAEAALSIDLENARAPHSLLNYGITTLEDFGIYNAVNVATETPVQVAEDCVKNTSFNGVLATPLLEYGDKLDMTVYGNTASSNVIAPVPNVLSLYSTVGVQLSTAAIPTQSGDLVVQNVVISSTHNPYGAVASDGVYRLDAQGADVVIRNCRIEGTLVVYDSDSVLVSGAVCWNSIDPARAALIASSSITFNAMDAVLSESTQSANFNPASTPNRGGVSNTTMLDTYPTSIRGVVYSLEDIYIMPMNGNERLCFYGSICAENLYVTARTNVLAEPLLLQNPPLGFRDPAAMKFVARSMRQIATP